MSQITIDRLWIDSFLRICCLHIVISPLFAIKRVLFLQLLPNFSASDFYPLKLPYQHAELSTWAKKVYVTRQRCLWISLQPSRNVCTYVAQDCESLGFDTRVNGHRTAGIPRTPPMEPSNQMKSLRSNVWTGLVVR
jgi:hypothetical protein